MTPTYTVGDDAIAKIVAHAAVRTPGVAKLAPSIGGRLRGTAIRATKRVLNSAPTDADPVADPDAVVVDEPDEEGGITTVTVRIVATTDPPVLQTVDAIHRAVSQALAEVPYDAEIVVQVIDVDPA